MSRLVHTLLLCLLCCQLSSLATERPVRPRGAYSFSGGLATVVIDGKWGYIDTTGELVIPAIYKWATGMYGGRAVVTLEDESFIIDTRGQRLDVPAEQSPWFEPQPLQRFEASDSDVSLSKVGFRDEEGNVVIPATLTWAGRFIEGRALVEEDRRFHFIDEKGAWAFPADYIQASEFSEGLAAVNLAPEETNPFGNGADWGYVDRDGRLVIPAAFDSAGDFFGGLASVRVGVYWGLIDKTGNFVIDPVYYQISSGQGGFVTVKNETGTSVLNLAGEVVIEPGYRDIGSVSEGLASVLVPVDGAWKWGFIDLQGELIIPPQFDEVESFSEGFAGVAIGNRHGYIDREGRYLWEPSE